MHFNTHMESRTNFKQTKNNTKAHEKKAKHESTNT